MIGTPVRTLHGEAERLGVAPSELEDVADLDAPGELERFTVDRAGVAGQHVGDVDHAVGPEVAAS